jgi:hypothetical protein
MNLTRRAFTRQCLLLFSVVLLGVAPALLTSGCGYAKHDDPPTYSNANSTQARLAAKAHARDIGGDAYPVANTHSMEPVLYGGYWITVDTHFPYDSITRGVIAVYQADWLPKDSGPVAHRTQVKDGDGWLMEGDNVKPEIDSNTGQNLHSETSWRMSRANYLGKVVAIYTTEDHQK